ncbi:hypothetical protein SCHPADRAFT_940580 [Schizopora paradoxa]|uniref:Uncharacterized protein n=1 Tax=Schizopora paradoxa TaxID=27342 RepID=A0A0H2RMN7_9AGAM|nr:hypothetical protein SCHPADRAFT_940580 [Schizopora paradoxa]
MSTAERPTSTDQHDLHNDEVAVEAQRAASPSSPPLQTASATRSSNMRKRPTAAPGGPRKPTSKPSMSNMLARTTVATTSTSVSSTVEMPPLPSTVAAQPYVLPAATEDPPVDKVVDSDTDFASALPLPASPISLSDASMLSRNSSLSSTYSFGVFRTSSVATRSSRRDTRGSVALTTNLESEIHSTTSLPYLSEDPPPPAPPAQQDQPPTKTDTVSPLASESVPPSRNPSLTAGSVQQRSSLASANLTSPTSTSSHFSAPKPPLSPPPSSSGSQVGAPTSSMLKAVKANAPSTTLTPPPLPTFATPSIPFRALPLDAAQWTLTSSELQGIVSRAIRASAEPSAIRLLPLQTLDGDLKKEEERLESEKAKLQARYRFVLQRRSMTMQALYSLAQTQTGTSSSQSQPSPSSPSPSPAPQSQNPMADVVVRLSQIAVELDTIAQELLSTTQQLAQLRQLQDIHAGSALAVALRKLNASFARRTREIATLKEQLAAAEAERDEAWRVAEEMAFEVDERDDDEPDERTGDTVVVNVTDRAVAAPATLERASRLAGVHLRVTGVGPRVVASRQEVNPDEEIEGEAVAAAPVPRDDDSAQLARTSSGSTLRTPGMRTGPRPRSNSAASRVSAARTRSQRTSKASLRIPRDFGGQRSRSRSRAREAPSPLDTSPRHPPLPSPISPAVTLNPPLPSSGNGTFLGPNGVPNVPKVPDPASYAHIPIPPIPADAPGPSSFLEMSTRPNSIVEKTDKGVSSSDSITNAHGAQVTNVEVASPQGNGPEDMSSHDITGVAVAVRTAVDQNVVIFSPTSVSASPTHPTVFSAQHQIEQHQILEQNASHHDQYPSVPQHTQHRHQHPFFKPSMSSLKAPAAQYRRPPPDSPIDVSAPSSTSSHGYDDDNQEDDDDYEDVEDEDAELMESFASAFGTGNGVATHVTKYGIFAGAGSNARRGTQTQSLLPFPLARKGSLTQGGAANTSPGPHRLKGQMSRGSLVQLGPNHPNHVQRPEEYQGMNISSSQSSPIYASNPTNSPRPFQGDTLSRRPTSLPSASSNQ